MKRHFILRMFICVVFFVSPLSYADQVFKFRLPEYNEPIYGTWLNEEYAGNTWWAQKWVYYNWGYSEVYNKTDDKNYSNKCTFILVEKWLDSEGNIWYKELDQMPGGMKAFWLNKISKDGAIFEAVYGGSDFPKENEMNPKSSAYRIYHRQ